MKKPFAITLDPGSSLANHTGSWRTVRPVYVDRLPPCNHACPAGENIQGWLFHAEAGNYEDAWRVLTRDNPLPATMGRVCYHPCETACNRGQLDEALRMAEHLLTLPPAARVNTVHMMRQMRPDCLSRSGWLRATSLWLMILLYQSMT